MKTKTRNRSRRHAEYDIQSDLERLKGALFDTTYDVRGKAGQVLSDSYETLKNKSTDMQENVAEYVAEKPFKSLGIALLSGVVIGFFLRK